MNKTTANIRGVQGLINRAKLHNNKIGTYQEHFITERFSYLARLSNGRLEIPRELAQDQEASPNSISEERIKALAARFQDH